MAKEIWAVPLGGNKKGRRTKYMLVIPVNVRSKRELAALKARLYGDDLSKKGKQDDIRINVNQAWERQYWARKLSVSQEELRKMVKEHGVFVRDVMSACGTGAQRLKPRGAGQAAKPR